ncbi:MAG: DUF4199 domain-containing protein [Bacteroidetes bacterium]|nr:DUF4199 domain-containing protein [Bacteroidota bacterium]
MKLNLRFGLIFFVIQSLWILGEFALGWHTTDVDVTRSSQGLFFIPAVAVMTWGLWAKKEADGFLAYRSALGMGAAVGLVVGALSVPFHLAYVKFLNPDFSANMIQGMVEAGQASFEQATEQFAMPRHLFGLLLFPVIAGTLTNAVAGAFLRTRSAKEDETGEEIRGHVGLT